LLSTGTADPGSEDNSLKIKEYAKRRLQKAEEALMKQ
jgi:hypothetical protein